MAHGSEKAVLTAIVANGILTILKFATALVTHSASMTNEAIHSLMDTLNQTFLWFGLKAADKPADSTYAFGHGQKKYLWNLWSAIGLFSIGAGLGLAHAWHSYHLMGSKAEPAMVTLAGFSISSLVISISVLSLALLLEGYSLIVATKQLLKGRNKEKQPHFIRYLLKHEDATLVAVVIEDALAVFGVLLAGTGISLSAWSGNPVWDIAFSAVIACLLGIAAFYLGFVNMRYLSAIRDHGAEAAFAKIAADHREIERYHDLRTIVVDDMHTVLVAEVELREEAMIPAMRPRIAVIEHEYLSMVPEYKRSDQKIIDYYKARAAAQATLERTETIIEELERQVKALAPQISHVTIEVEGIATPPDSDQVLPA